MRPATSRSSVDFPHPDGPITETNSPSLISSEMSWRASSSRPGSWNRLDTPVSETAEAVQFLEWLLADNFTFLGVREYVLSGDTMLSPVLESGLGVLRSPELKVLRGGRGPLEGPAALQKVGHGVEVNRVGRHSAPSGKRRSASGRGAAR